MPFNGGTDGKGWSCTMCSFALWWKETGPKIVVSSTSFYLKTLALM